MKKKLYYVVEKSLNDVQECDGNKNVTVYEIIDNEPRTFFTLDLLLEECTVDYIQDYLNEIGNADDEFEFVQL